MTSTARAEVDEHIMRDCVLEEVASSLWRIIDLEGLDVSEGECKIDELLNLRESKGNACSVQVARMMGKGVGVIRCLARGFSSTEK